MEKKAFAAPIKHLQSVNKKMMKYFLQLSFKGPFYQFDKFVLNENIGVFSVSCSKLLKKLKNLKEIRTP